MKLKKHYYPFFMFIGLFLMLFVNEIHGTPPANDNLANIQLLSGASGTANGSTIDATRQVGEAAHDFARTVERTVWFQWTPTVAKPVVFEITSADFDVAIAVYTGANTFPLSTFVRNNDTFGTRARVEFGASPAENYKIVVGLYGSANDPGGNFSLEWTTNDTPTNDNFANALALETPQKGSVVLTRMNATKEIGEPAHITGNRSVWFNYTNDLPTDYSVTFSTVSFDLKDTTLAVYTGSTVDNLTPIVKNDNVAGTSSSRATFLAKSGITYRIAVDEGSNPNSGSTLLNWGITKLKRYTDFGLKDTQTTQIIDDDGADISVFRPSEGIWYWLNSANSSFQAFQFGIEGDTPVPTDYDGDGLTDLAIVRETNGQKVWWIRNSFDDSYRSVQWGLSEDKLVPGDYDFDGRADIAVFRPSNNFWYILRSSDGQVFVKEFGASGDIPVLGDFKGTPDGNDLAVFRPSNGTWYIFDGENTIFVPFGTNGDKPVVGDYDNDGKSDIAVYRPSDGVWYVIRSRTNQLQFVQWGSPDDIPMSGDYDNNSNDLYDFAVFRPGNQTWYVLKAEGTQIQYRQFGLSGDIPVSSLNHLAH